MDGIRISDFVTHSDGLYILYFMWLLQWHAGVVYVGLAQNTFFTLDIVYHVGSPLNHILVVPVLRSAAHFSQSSSDNTVKSNDNRINCTAHLTYLAALSLRGS